MGTLKRELDILSELDHPNILKVIEVYEDEKYVHIVTEYCCGGDLFDNLVRAGSFTEAKAADTI